MTKPYIGAEALRKIVSYNSETGEFRWCVDRNARARAGSLVGCPHPEGYLRCKIADKDYLLHRLAWLYVHGHLPAEDIDHRNGIRTDNRLSNLRPVTKSENMQNQRRAMVTSATGLLGVSRRKRGGGFIAQITVAGKQRVLGYFDQAEVAYAAYLDAKRALHPASTL